MALTIDDATRAELSRFGLDDAQLAAFAKRAGDTAQTYLTGAIARPTDDDVSVLPAPGTPSYKELAARGDAAIRAGEVGVVVLAGGMATRFGGVVKAAVPVTGSS